MDKAGMSRFARILVAGVAFLSAPVLAQPSGPALQKVVEEFVAAFNAQDSAAMSRHVTEDVQWLSVNADKIAVETRGKAALVSSMNDYFKSCPSCRSSLQDVTATGSRVSAVEEASWRTADGSKSQRSLAVYEFSGGLIQRVYYFPAEESATAAPESGMKLFAVEFRTGPQWIEGKPPNEQQHFREHSANLRQLRAQGTLVLGARYSDKGFIVLAAESEAAARALIDQDPAVKHGIFVYELHEFAVFYGGSVQAPRRKS